MNEYRLFLLQEARRYVDRALDMPTNDVSTDTRKNMYDTRASLESAIRLIVDSE